MKHSRKFFLILVSIPGLIVIMGIIAMEVMIPVSIEQMPLTLLLTIAAVFINMVPFGLLSVVHFHRACRKDSILNYSFYTGYIFGILAMLLAILILLREISLGRPGSQLAAAGFFFLPFVTAPVMVVSYIISSVIDKIIHKRNIISLSDDAQIEKAGHSYILAYRMGAYVVVAIFIILLFVIPRTLIKKGIIPAAKIHDAAEFGSTRQVEKFISKGVDINAKDEYGETPLHIAAFYGHRDMIEFLIENGAIINAKDNDSRTPLHEAAWAGKTKTVAILIGHNANVNVQDDFGDTPLHSAVHKARKSTIRVLLAHGADVNLQNKVGQSPLWDAVYWGYKDLVELFIEQGAEVNIADKWGRTPLGIARQKGYERIERLLLKQGAKEDKQ